MLTLGTWDVKTLSDGWTVVTRDSSLAAHFEHTVALTEAGPEILSVLPQEEEARSGS
jgi:methionyl aminopeptidase